MPIWRSEPYGSEKCTDEGYLWQYHRGMARVCLCFSHGGGVWVGMLSTLSPLAAGPAAFSARPPMDAGQSPLQPRLWPPTPDQRPISRADAPAHLLWLCCRVHRNLPYRAASRLGSGVPVGRFLSLLQRHARYLRAAG